MADRVWDRADASAELPPVRVRVEGHPLVTHGAIVVDGNNPWVVVKDARGKCLASRRYSWGLVLQYLNGKHGERLDVDPGHERAPAAPEPWDGFFPEDADVR